MKIKVLGINGSPRRRGNTWVMLSEALKAASELNRKALYQLHSLIIVLTAFPNCHLSPPLSICLNRLSP